jgi:branched-chain amino acid transport system substrate-binding protein
MKKLLLGTVCGVALALTGTVAAAMNNISDGYVKIGILTDLSGPFSDVAGPGSIIAAQMAIDDFGGTVLGKPIKLVSGNFKDQTVLGSSIARRWIDQKHVDVITGLSNSAVGLAVQKLGSEKHTIVINTGGTTSALTESQCTEYGIHYNIDSYSLASTVARGLIKNGANKTWFFIRASYELGSSLEDDATFVIKQLGGKVLGSIEAPLSTTDYSSYLIQAKASGADVIGMAVAGQMVNNIVKQAHEFGITEHGQKLAGMAFLITNIKSLGLKTAQGITFSSGFYWDRTKASREWSKRFFKKHHAMPTVNQAAEYSAIKTYLTAVENAGTDDSDAVRAAMGEMTINDMYTQGAHIAPNGVLVHDFFLMKVKSPKESHGPWDLAKIITTVPGKKAFIRPSGSKCPLMHN